MELIRTSISRQLRRLKVVVKMLPKQRQRKRLWRL